MSATAHPSIIARR